MSSKTKACEWCRYFSAPRTIYEMHGECRINPPDRGGWPRVYPVGWCAQFNKDDDMVDDEIRRLKERLEMWPIDPKTREFLKDMPELGESCDGIACRDETIRQLDKQRDRGVAKIEALRANRVEIQTMLEQLQDNNKHPEKLPSREQINIILGGIIEKCSVDI